MKINIGMIKKGLGIPKNQNQFYASVATLAVLAVLLKRQAFQIDFPANGYTFALLAITRITTIHTVFRVHRIFPHVQQNRFLLFHLTFSA